MTVYTLFGQPALGLTVAFDTSEYTMGMQFTLSQSATLSGIWFYSGTNANALPNQCCIFLMTGAGTGTVVPGSENDSPSWSGAAASGWVKCAYASGPTLTAGSTYKVCIHKQNTDAHIYSLTSNYWSSGAGSGGLTSGIITAPNNAGGDGGQDTFVVPSSGLNYPASSFGASNYWVDVEVTGLPDRVVLPASPLMPPGRQSPAAWQFLRRPQTGQTSLPSITGSGGVTLPKPALSGTGAITAAPTTPVGSWWGLDTVFKQSRQEFEAYASRPPMACPNDGEPLINAPATMAGSGCQLYCKYDGWQYPRDWIPPTRP